jgi:SAM-dependent methyltransferase
MNKFSLLCLLWLGSSLNATILPETDHSFGTIATHEHLDALSEGLKMPTIMEHGQVAVINQDGGYAIIYLDPISEKFVAYCKTIDQPVLDIGAGYGTASLEVLNNATCPIIAEDIGIENLLILRKRSDPKHFDRLFLNSNRFPDQLELPPHSLGAVSICQVLHFLRGEEIDLGLQKIYDWLVPGGKLFIVTCSPFVSNLIDFVPIYEKRWAEGIAWPGMVENFRNLVTNEYGNLPPFLHVIDERPMKAALIRAGFEIEEMTFVDRRKTIPFLSLDGRESIGVIATKPLK